VTELKTLAKQIGVTKVPIKVKKRVLIEMILEKNKSHFGDYRNRCLNSPFESVKKLASAARLFPDGKTQAELCDEIAWLREGNPDPVEYSACDNWIRNPGVNPRTLRQISPKGRIFKTLQKECVDEIAQYEALNPSFSGSFQDNKLALTEYFVDLFDKHVFSRKLKGHLRVEFHPGYDIPLVGATVIMYYGRVVKIMLSSAIIINMTRLRDTLIHEMCHAAVSVIDGIYLQSEEHGPEWRKWVNLAHQTFPMLPQITTTVTYGQIA